MPTPSSARPQPARGPGAVPASAASSRLDFSSKGPGTSVWDSGSDFARLGSGRADSFYTAWCKMNSVHKVFTSETSEVSTAFDNASVAWHFPVPPPPPPPPPPRRPRSPPYAELQAAVPQEHPHNGTVTMSNPYGPDPPADVAAYRPAMSDPCGSTPPKEEPAFAALAHLRVSAASSPPQPRPQQRPRGSQNGTPTPISESDESAVQAAALAALANLRVYGDNPNAQSSPHDEAKPTADALAALQNLRVYGEVPRAQEPTASANPQSCPANIPPLTAAYLRGEPQPQLSPCPTVYELPPEYLAQLPQSAVSTVIDAPHTGGNEHVPAVMGFNPVFPPGVPIKPDDLLREHSDFPLGVSALLENSNRPAPEECPYFSQDRCRSRAGCSPSQWCGLFDQLWQEEAQGCCSQCHGNLQSFFDHHCPKCSNAVCISCVERLNGGIFRCSCGDHTENQPKIERTLWMLSAYRSTVSVLDSIASAFTCAKPTGASQGYTAMMTPSRPHHAGSPLLETPPSTEAHRTRLPPYDEEITAAEAKQAAAPPPPPPPPPLPSLLGHRRRISQFSEPFKTHLPGEMPF